jgi:phosphoglycolate phosphatase
LPALGAPEPARALRAARLPLPKILLCDLDGTLIDTMPDLAELAAEVMQDVLGLPRFLGRELYLATCGLPFDKQLQLIAPDDPRNPEAVVRFEARKPALYQRARMPADTRRAISALRHRGVAVVVSSNNGAANVQAFARAAGFPFDLAMGYDGAQFGKGRPHIARAAQAFGARRDQMLFVGDSLHDADIAEREGIGFVAVTGTFSRERFSLRFPGLRMLSRFSEITDLFAFGATPTAR